MSGLIRELQVGSVRLTVETVKRASKYIVLTGNDLTDFQSIVGLELLRNNVSTGTSNDVSKYNLIEAYKTELTWSINMRSLQNFISLRSDKSALWEIRDLANMVYVNLPEEHKYLYVNHIKGAE